MTVSIHHASCLDWLAEYDGPLFDSCVTDPPYEIGFMGKKWDNTGVAFQPETWRAIYDVLKPGAHLVAFSGTRTYHRMACAIEDAGFEIRDQLAWAYGAGFPKSHDVSKGIDKAAGAEREVVGIIKGGQPAIGQNGKHCPIKGAVPVNGRVDQPITAPATPEAEQWQGWGTALKPSWEPICLARKPLSEKSVAANVLKHGTGAINIDACRVGTEGGGTKCGNRDETGKCKGRKNAGQSTSGETFHGPESEGGRWPANLCHDGSDEVLAGFPETGAATARVSADKDVGQSTWSLGRTGTTPRGHDDNGGSAARFFKSASYSEEELILYRAKAKVAEWNSDLANTVDNSTALSNEAAASALSDAVTWAFRVTVKSCQGLSTGATPSELRRTSEAVIAAMLIIESGCSQEWLQERPILNGCRVSIAETQKQTGTITITISHWKSSGCAEPVTFSITPQSAELGEAASPRIERRFHYSAKAGPLDRIGTAHATVKPVDLMRWLVRMVTPPAGCILEPFAGSGKTGIAAMAEGFDCTMIDIEAEHVADIERQLAFLRGDGAHSFKEHNHAKLQRVKETPLGGLFGEAA